MNDNTDPMAIVSRVFERINAHDVQGISEYLADVVAEDWPITGHFAGREAVREHWMTLFAAVPDLHLAVLRMAREGETVFVYWRATGTFSGGPLTGIEATGKHIDFGGTNCLTIRDAKVVDNFIGYDGMAFAMQAGVMPRPGTVAHRVMNTAINGLTRVKRALATEPAA